MRNPDKTFRRRFRSRAGSEFARRLCRIMDEQGLSGSDVAALMNGGREINTEGKNVARGRDRLSVWTRGLSLPSKANLEKLAKALGVEVGELMPEAEMKAAYSFPIDYQFSTPPGCPPGKVFVNVTKWVSSAAAHEIMGLLIRDEALS
jgi:transcriptional regulator with XRE-family HTH domain